MAKKMLFLFVLLLSLTGMLKAQVTTAGMSGKVMADEESVIGATVVAVHEPSGTSYGTVTNVDGRFSLQGMRSGEGDGILHRLSNGNLYRYPAATG